MNDNSKFYRLCVFGSYVDSEYYARNRVLIDALSQSSIEVIEVRAAKSSKHQSNQEKLSSVRGLVRTIIQLFVDAAFLLRQRRCLSRSNLFFVPYPAYLDLLLLRYLLRKRNREDYKIIVDAFLCLQDTLVSDRKMISPGSILDKTVSWLEGETLKVPDLVFIDTSQHKALLQRMYGIEPHRLATIPVGIDESVWHPLPQPIFSGTFYCLFWGTFIPLHGIETIIKAAALVQIGHPNIEFIIIGDGQTANTVAELIAALDVTNITWHRAILPGQMLVQHLESAHCVLGIFGDSDKAGNVVPYKAHQTLAANRILITRSGPALSALTHDKDIPGLVLIPPGDPQSLATAIHDIYVKYPSLSSFVETRKLYDQHLSQRMVYSAVADEVAKL
ncbi:glycosyltransferase family 4 protein [Parahaliea maris]|uniref:Glycosyltransferase family 4 protein n=1 Tax=Parahaliea maris TaxID=2716870 RepID=A0A5C9A6U6_9GAMM|nr:glycosyltransferase [Parahaliea maris]TXS96693.1 glycosyltransferase family 4 protein [Parahaliea maris]